MPTIGGIALALLIGLSSLPESVDWNKVIGFSALLVLIIFLGAKSGVSHKQALAILRRRTFKADLLAPDKFKSLSSRAVFQLEFNYPTSSSRHGTVRIDPFDDSELIGPPPISQTARGEPINYRIYDVIVDIYDEDKSEVYKTAEAYYTVFEVKLRQIVPHLLFDGKFAKSQQFHSIYLPSQKIEGIVGLDDYFAVYSPKYHQIEALSFITPEVVESLIQLQDCDIEIIDDSLFCYASLLNEQQLSYFRDRCLNLHLRLNDNLPVYNFSQKEIAPFGRQLQKDEWQTLVIIILVAIVSTIFMFYYDSSLLVVHLPVVAFMIASFAWKAIRQRFKNKKLEEEFLQQSEFKD